jgi:hypothetical protein
MNSGIICWAAGRMGRRGTADVHDLMFTHMALLTSNLGFLIRKTEAMAKRVAK